MIQASCWEYFGLKADPFSIAPDPAFLYPGIEHRRALANLKYGLEREGGFILLTGEVGTGKTTLVRLLLEQVPPGFRVAYVLNTLLNREEVLASICDELDIKVTGTGAPGLKHWIDALHRDLLEHHARGARTLVILEEAQNLSAEVLETLRLLTNLETNTTKLLHILLVGQPELLQILAQPELRQLNQRVVSRFHLMPLKREESREYVRHRIARAGCQRPIFSPRAVNELHHLSGGVPRKINLIAERALVGAFSESMERVGARHVRLANREVFGSPENARTRRGWRGWWLIATLILALGALLPLAVDQSRNAPPETAPASDPINTTVDVPLNEPLFEPIVEPLVEPSVAPAVAALPPTPYSALLQLWNIESASATLADMCAIASNSGLYCDELPSLEPGAVRNLNRPALVWLNGIVETELPLLVIAASADGLIVLDAQGERRELAPNPLLETAEGIYLWRAPAGYLDALRVGDRNIAVVEWLQLQLQQYDGSFEPLITGGRFSEALSNRLAQVQRDEGLTPDGILGRQSIMKLNELVGDVPQLEVVEP